MNETSTTFNWGWIIGLVIVLWFLSGGTIFGANNRNCGVCEGVSPCQIEKQEIIDSAATRYLIEQSTRNSTDAIIANQRAQYNQEQQEKIFDLKLQNFALQNQLSQQAQSSQISDQFCALNRRLDLYECQTPKAPTFYAAGGYAPAVGYGFVPAGYNYGYYTGNCGTCASGNF